MPNKAKVLFFDIESSNLAANFGYMLAFGWKWQHENHPKVVSISQFPRFRKDCTDDLEVVKTAYRLIESADVIVAHYGQRFDVPFINTRLLYHKLPFLPNVPLIDTWRISRDKLRLNSNRLGSVANLLLGKSEKTQLSGPEWIRAAAGHEPSIKYVADHCKHDVLELEKVYNKIKGLCGTHPNVSLVANAGGEQCPICGSRSLQKRGIRIAKARKFQRLHCQSCGHWGSGVAISLDNPVEVR